MPRINVTLVVARDGDTGDLGLIVQGLDPVEGKVNTAGSGLLIAHDLIEHVNGIRKIGSIDDELEALGAIWYVRGQHGDLSRDGSGSAYTPEKNIASDVTRMFRDYFYGQHVSMAPLRTLAHDYDETFREIIAISEREKEHEFDADDAQWARDNWPAYAAQALHRMRMGFNKAKRRWHKHGQHAANSAFWEIADAVQPHTRRLDYEGMEFKLRYDSNAQCATCWET